MQDNNHKYKAAAYRILAIEAVLTAVVALLLLITVNSVVAYSAAIGGVTYIVPNYYFAKYVFRHSAAESAGLAVRWFYMGEAVKLLATALIFAAAFLSIRPLNAAALFLTYILMWLLNLRGMFLLMKR